MHSYIDIHHFAPISSYKPLADLIPLIDDALFEQDALTIVGKQHFASFRVDIIKSMEIYYQLVGIDERVIASGGTLEPEGILPRLTKSLINYFRQLEDEIPINKEITALKYSGLTTIKIRYKYTDSVIKKLVKLGLRDPNIFKDPLHIFLRGGVLHDLIGILFVCSYPYEKEWIARALYNFFEYKHRSDDHLVYGFYTVKKKSGYQGLHCDTTLFNPRFDHSLSSTRESLPLNSQEILEYIPSKYDESTLLHTFKDYFNIEIQIHTTFENLWATMEHTKSYNILAKGRGRNSEITVQWKLLSDTMHNLEKQFEQLQIDTDQAQFKSAPHRGYTFVKEILNILDPSLQHRYKLSNDKIANLEKLLKSHEISRQEYVQQLHSESEYIYALAYEQEHLSVRSIFLLHSAYIYYGLSTYHEYFNSEDIKLFVKKAQELYKEIDKFLSQNPDIFKANLLNVVAIIRYLYLEHKHRLGLMLVDDENYNQTLSYFAKGISILNELNDEDLHYLKEDNASYLKIIHYFDTLAREWELFPTYDTQSKLIEESIRKFRAHYVNISLELHFQMLLDRDKITNVGLVVKFYTTLIWHGIITPIVGLKQIIKYSAYDRIETSDLFYYELAAYRYLIMCCCGKTTHFCNSAIDKESDPVRIKHLENYHKENMIQQLFRIKRNESLPEFEKARLNFEQLTGEKFQMDHFSDHLSLVQTS